jgi:hypothetical protein
MLHRILGMVTFLQIILHQKRVMHEWQVIDSRL